ncbi:uncharacterized protein LOC117315169 isoform X2 [Pecten maximus]|uniref:uncharacterized protein LOC117315169 isoform X2 n=1 Tax=Pecten maximus TaxID=6579 RepID=UPI0014584B82|nr:uncharacterized protein LOC117315169 isoform X2 [Pecten maximus]
MLTDLRSRNKNMKIFLAIVLYCCLSIGCAAVHISCFGKLCHSHESTCIVYEEHGSLKGYCEEREHCNHLWSCNDTHGPGHGRGHEECCCASQQCVDSFSTGTGTMAASLNCFGHQCDAHRSTCLVNMDHEMNGRCEDDHVCRDHDTCTASSQHLHGPHHECCCRDQTCIDNLKAAQSLLPHLTCFGHHCDSFKSSCIVTKGHELTGRCEPAEQCHHHTKCTAAHHGHEHECCCTDQHCIDSLTSGTSAQQSSLACGRHICNKDGDRPYCRLYHEEGHLYGECVEERQCLDRHHKLCSVVHDTYGHGCCCQHDTCISTMTGIHHANSTATSSNNVTSNNNGIFVNGLKCSQCSDVGSNTCVHDHLTCGANEVCKIKESLQGAVSTECKSILQCARDKIEDARHPTQPHTLCCATDNCTSNAVHNSSQGHLTCPMCNNQFLGDCHGDHLCSVGETCMFEAKNGMLSTKCSPNCHQQGSTVVCCSDNYCVGSTIKQLNQASFVCPRCTDSSEDNCLANTITCIGNNEGCSVKETNKGFTVGCSSSMQDCTAIANKNSGVCSTSSPLDNTTACQTCCQKNDIDCIRQAFRQSVDTATTPAPPVPTTAPKVTTTQKDMTTVAHSTQDPSMLDTTAVQQSSQPSIVKTTIAPTMHGPSMLDTTTVRQTPQPTPGGFSSTRAPVVTSTPMAPTPKVCADKDPANCQTMHAALCTANDTNIHHLAVVTCAKSCGFCDEYLQLDTTTTPAPPVPTTTPKVTTTQKVCIDTDPDSCVRMQGALCPTTDPNLHHMAVVTCAKTCDFCDEFMLV